MNYLKRMLKHAEGKAMQSNPIVWFEIYVDDMPRAKQFYEKVLGVTLEQMNNPTDIDVEMWGFPSNQEGYGATGALAKMKDVPAGGNSTLVYFSCEDCSCLLYTSPSPRDRSLSRMPSSA